MQHVHITQGIDIALVVMNAFFLFFAGLILYLRREDRREGYPLEEENGGRFQPLGGVFFAADAKTFIRPFGQGNYTTNKLDHEPQLAGMQRTSVYPGSPYEPLGDPLVDGVGPAAFANRDPLPDVTMDGHPRVVPIASAPGFYITARDPDPRGYAMVGSDGSVAGTITDIWVDQSDHLIRYLEARLTGEAGRSVLVPMAMCVVNRKRQTVTTDSIAAAQFAKAPAIASATQITRYEEERVTGYFGGGYLYASPERAEPLL